MTKHLIRLSMILLAILMASCTKTLDDLVEVAKEKLPMEMGDGMEMTKIKLTKKFLQIECTYSEKDIRLDSSEMETALNAMSEQIKKQFIEEMDEELLKRCVEEDKGIKMVMKGEKSGTSLTLLEMSADEIDEMM